MTIAGNNILMKSDRIILPTKLRHPGVSQLETRL